MNAKQQHQKVNSQFPNSVTPDCSNYIFPSVQGVYYSTAMLVMGYVIQCDIPSFRIYFQTSSIISNKYLGEIK